MATRKEPLGVLLVTGMRTHQENYAPAFAADPRCRLVGLTDESDVPELRDRLNRELADELKVPFLDDLDAALTRSDVDIVCICAEPERRARIGVRAARAGKHVYMDKPLATSVAEADALASAVKSANVQSQMFTLVHTGWAARAREIVAAERIGKLQGIHCDLLFAKGPAGSAPLGTPRTEHFPPERFTFVDSKREMFTTAVYSLAMIRVLTRSEVRSVRAVTANYFFAEHVRNDVEDFAALSLTLDNGVVATVTAGRIGWRSHPSYGPVRTVLVGTGGNVLIDGHRPRVEVATDATSWTAPRRNPDDPMGFWSSTTAAAGAEPKLRWITPTKGEPPSDQTHFVDCLLSNRAPDVTVADGAAVVEVLLAAYQSAATGRVVQLPLPRT